MYAVGFSFVPAYTVISFSLEIDTGLLDNSCLSELVDVLLSPTEKASLGTYTM